MNILLNGATGRMGKEVIKKVILEQAEIVNIDVMVYLIK